jgi:hypothetical protein
LWYVYQRHCLAAATPSINNWISFFLILDDVINNATVISDDEDTEDTEDDGDDDEESAEGSADRLLVF